jgi:polysaccharide export outer membrane protein
MEHPMSIATLIVLLACAPIALAQQEERLNLPEQPIGPNDLITVTVYKQKELSGTQRVSAYGSVRLPMLKDEVSASGLLPGALSAIVAKAYVDAGILVDPQVTVSIAEYQSHPIQVGGAVKAPTTFQAATPITLLQAIAKAGGLSENAGPDIVIAKKGEITRRISVKALFGSGDDATNVILTGGEEVRVPEAGRVFVVGNVRKPCTYVIDDGGESSVLKAMAYSEGLQTYSTKSAYIYRREGHGARNEIEIPLRDIMARKANDIALLPDDILYVPEDAKKKNVMSALGKVLLIGGGAALTAVLVYR